MTIHPTAVIAATVRLHPSVQVGAYCVIEGDVTLGEGCVVHSHVAIAGRTTIGVHNHIFPFASIGHAPQDLKYQGEPSQLIIGDHNVIREHVTLNPGTAGGGLITKIGSHCLFMVASHVAHDCQVGDHVILANNATLAGHVTVGDHVIIGGLSAVHQFVRIGSHAMIGGMSGVEHDVIPFGSVMGERANLAGLNLVGLKRRGFERDAIHALRGAYKMLFEEGAEGSLAERLPSVQKAFGTQPQVQDILRFIDEKSARSLCVPKHGDILMDTQAA